MSVTVTETEKQGLLVGMGHAALGTGGVERILDLPRVYSQFCGICVQRVNFHPGAGYVAGIGCCALVQAQC